MMYAGIMCISGHIYVCITLVGIVCSQSVVMLCSFMCWGYTVESLLKDKDNIEITSPQRTHSEAPIIDFTIVLIHFIS